MKSQEETILFKIYTELESIVKESFPDETIDSLLSIYTTFSYYNGLFFFKKDAKSQDIIVKARQIRKANFYFMKIKKSHSGREISDDYNAAELLKILPTRKSIINIMLEEL